MRRIAVVLALFCSCDSSSHPGGGTPGSTILYTNLGAGQTYGSNFQFVQLSGGAPGMSAFYIGTKFVAAASGKLSQVLVPVANSQGVETFALYADPAGAPSSAGFAGQPLESWTDVTVPKNSSSIPIPSIPLLTLQSAARPALTAGSSYWLWVKSTQTGAEPCCPPGSPPAVCTPKPSDANCPPSGVSPTLGSFWADALTGSGGYWGGPFATSASSTSSPPPAIELNGDP